MARELPGLDLLKGFEAAARQLSFTKAGAELFLTQSAISRQVQALEEQLGVKLFHRRTRALLLTDEERHKLSLITDLIDERVRPYLQGDGGDLYVVQGAEKEHLIPAVKEIVAKVDFDEKKVIIDPPAGLLDL